MTTLHEAAERSNSTQYLSDITTGKFDAHDKLGTIDGQNHYQETQICQSQNTAGNAKSELHLQLDLSTTSPFLQPSQELCKHPGISHGRDSRRPSAAGGGRGARPVSGGPGPNSESRDGLCPGAPQHPRQLIQAMPGYPRRTTAPPGLPATTCARRGSALTHRLLCGHHVAASRGVGRYLEHRGTEGSGQNPTAAPAAAPAPPARPRSPQTRRQDGRAARKERAPSKHRRKPQAALARATHSPPYGCQRTRTAAEPGAGPVGEAEPCPM